VKAQPDPDQYFAQRRLSLRVGRRDLDAELPADALSRGSPYWADLVSIESGRVVARSYGSGSSVAEAKASAVWRHQVEQEPAGPRT
jgi:hypothetical protein